MRHLPPALLSVCLALAPATCTDEPDYVPDDPPTTYTIGEDFEWGTAMAAYTVEGGNTDSDWAAWERRCVLDRVDGIRRLDETITDCASNTDGPGFWDSYAADLAEAAAMGHTAVRLAVAWSKVEPRPGVYDDAVIGHYRDVFTQARSQGLAVMVTLQHGSLPRWIHDIDGTSDDPGLGGWAGLEGSSLGPGQSPVVAAFTAYAGKMAQELGDLVDLWVTIDQPFIQVQKAYLNAAGPPGELMQLGKTIGATVNMLFAHAGAYEAIHAADTADADGDGVAAQVGLAKQWRVFDPYDPEHEGDMESAERMSYLFNHLAMDAVVSGKLDYNADGDLEDDGEQVDPRLEAHLDWVGVTYLSRVFVVDSLILFCTEPPCEEGEGVPVALFYEDNPDPAAVFSDDGWEVYPQGLYRSLIDARHLDLPIRVTSNGVADASDRLRPAFIVQHIEVMETAMEEGADVRGYYHYSLLDGLEWSDGFGPRYGLLRVDFDYPSHARTRSEGAAAYTAIIQARGVTEEILGEYVGE